MIFFEDVKCVVNDRDVMWHLMVDDDGNAVLTLDLSQSPIGNGSIIIIYFSVKIVQRAITCNISI
ncbi:MAG: hypothetical protein QXJ00_06025, partial [Candidatus Nezhaarchaeales archaeon]